MEICSSGNRALKSLTYVMLLYGPFSTCLMSYQSKCSTENKTELERSKKFPDFNWKIQISGDYEKISLIFPDLS